MSVDTYYTTLMGLFDELYRLKPLHVCSCGQSTCDIVGKFAADREEEKLHQFLVGIDDDAYGTVRSNLLSQTPFPDLGCAHQAFLQEENSRAIACGKTVAAAEVQAFALKADRTARTRDDKVERVRPVCTHCRQKGHEISTCFKLHGYPEWWEECQRAKGQTGG
ncbi:unnamed protein product [Cuscuta epithymum]|uniref:Uncharacterized protein n=1 Tax=Cuscuta epithymum TaxID=186058 RepID=A0AAV0GF73_9ASTE|nr:unnamed protein product [Cuscuta epithymum]